MVVLMILFYQVEVDICSLTSQFEDFVVQLIDRLFLPPPPPPPPHSPSSPLALSLPIFIHTLSYM